MYLNLLLLSPQIHFIFILGLAIAQASITNFTLQDFAKLSNSSVGEIALYTDAANLSKGCESSSFFVIKPYLDGRVATNNSFRLEYVPHATHERTFGDKVQSLALTYAEAVSLLTISDMVSEVEQCGTTSDSDNSCLLVYECFLITWNTGNDEFLSCLAASQVLGKAWTCYFRLTKSEEDVQSCAGGRALDADLWSYNNVDNLTKIMLNGGVDPAYNFVWLGPLENETLMETIGRSLLNDGALSCDLNNPCTDEKTCDQVGSWTAIALGKTGQVYEALWCYLFYAGFRNLNQQLANQYNELQHAIESLALDAFNIDTYFPKPNQDFDLLDAFSGLGGLFTILGGFIPFVGPGLEVAGATANAIGTVASGISGFLGTAVAASTDPLRAQKIFSEKVLAFYRAYLAALEDAVYRLFRGETLGENPGFNVTDMLANGVWLSPNSIQNVSDLNQKIRVEILSRSIDSMWKTFSSNKMWVTFVDLNDSANGTKCLADASGPNSSKYCDNGGVYYTYNFLESNYAGEVGYPWGAQSLPESDIQFSSVTKASARSFRLMRSLGGDPFNFTQINGTATFLKETLTGTSSVNDLSSAAGQYPGSWTLPVCDMSGYGSSWNFDYEAPIFVKTAVNSHPPCLCGPGGNETFAWAKAAGMRGFETFWSRCESALTNRTFQWPDGVTQVVYPVNGDGNNRTISKPR